MTELTYNRTKFAINFEYQFLIHNLYFHIYKNVQTVHSMHISLKNFTSSKDNIIPNKANKNPMQITQIKRKWSLNSQNPNFCY